MNTKWGTVEFVPAVEFKRGFGKCCALCHVCVCSTINHRVAATQYVSNVTVMNRCYVKSNKLKVRPGIKLNTQFALHDS